MFVIGLQAPHQPLNVPFTYGIAPAGALLCAISTLNVTNGIVSIVRFNCSVTQFVVEPVYIHEALYVCPFHEYETYADAVVVFTVLAITFTDTPEDATGAVEEHGALVV